MTVQNQIKLRHHPCNNYVYWSKQFYLFPSLSDSFYFHIWWKT